MNSLSPAQQTVTLISMTTSAALWLCCYVLIIRRGFKDQSYGMPLIPLCVNLSYEFIFGFLLPDQPPMNYANMAWFVVDLLIAFQYLRYGRRDFSSAVPQRWFVPGFLLALAVAFVGVLTLTYDLEDWAGNYSGWGCQLLISVSFSFFLLRRGSVRGQSLYIALTRLCGTLALVPGQALLAPRSLFLAFVYVTYPIFDLIYIVLYLRQCRAEGSNPWRRV
jgi:hypothetical protein